MTPEQIEEARTLLHHHYHVLNDHMLVDDLCNAALKVANPDMVLVPREPDDVTLACIKAAINEVDDTRVHVRHVRAAYAWLVTDTDKRAAMKEPKAP